MCRKLTTITADFQTSGRGQRGNSWESEAGQNLMFSFVLYPTFLKARRQFLLSQIISLAIKEELERYVSNISINGRTIYIGKTRKFAACSLKTI